MLCQLSYGVESICDLRLVSCDWTGWIRTIDLFLIKELLYRLSYGPGGLVNWLNC